nr:MAG TPA: hypothetical protein [Caudoviricetes sp.]
MWTTLWTTFSASKRLLKGLGVLPNKLPERRFCTYESTACTR